MLLRLIPAALVALLSLPVPSHAHSRPFGPLAVLSHPTVHSLDILPRPHSHPKRSSPELLHSDTFRLSLSLPDRDDPVHLHLSPTEYLVHPAARIDIYEPGPDGEGEVLASALPLSHAGILAYTGHVLPPELTSQRLLEDSARVLSPSLAPPLGEARIVVHAYDPYSGEPPLFEGMFELEGERWEVLRTEVWARVRGEVDARTGREGRTEDVDSRLVIFKSSDVLPHPGVAASEGAHTCAHDSLAANDLYTNPLMTAYANRTAAEVEESALDMLGSVFGLRAKRSDVAGGGNMSSNFIGEIGSTAACPKEQKIVYMGVAADCNYVAQYGGTGNATQQIITDWNTVSGLYKSTFNISLGLVSLSIHSPTCPTTPDPSFPWNTACTTNATLNDRLNTFSGWRGQKGGADGAGLWHLMSACPTGDEVGVAWLGVLCAVGNGQVGAGGETVSGCGVTTATKMEWQVVAHEIGHNFGAIHDCTSGCSLDGPCCPYTTSTCDANNAFIMNPVSLPNQTTFSQCTVGNICSLLSSLPPTGTQSDNTTCLVTPSSSIETISLQMCGNGIVEPGEECDPGLGSNSTCCDVQTCKFVGSAVCDPSNSACCLGTCQFAPSTQVCRPAKSAQCDVAEMCTGSSGDCPADVTVPDGSSCGLSGMACASGLCTSNDLQCQTVGASMNLTSACPQEQTSCQVSCADPTNANQCVILQSYLTPGSPCGYGGKCYNNACQPGSLMDTISAWYKANLQIAIPVTVVVGIVALLLIWGLFIWIRRCCRRAKQRKMAPSAAFKPQPEKLSPLTVAAFARAKNQQQQRGRYNSSSDSFTPLRKP